MQQNNIILNPEQEKIKNKAVEWFFHSTEQVFEIDGAAGTGKSVLIKAILDALKLQTSEYYAMSYTGQAAIVMRTKGFKNAKSIHSTLYELIEVYKDPLDEDEDDIQSEIMAKFGIRPKRTEFRLKWEIDPNIKLFFIDEGYMVPRYMVRDILSFNIKVIVAGDSHQLPPVGDDPGFLVNPGINHLTQLMRQSENSPIVYLAQRVLHGLPINTGMYGNDVMIINKSDVIQQMYGYCDCVLCGTNRTREFMNNTIRNLAGFRGQLPHRTERVICKKNNWNMELDGVALANGLQGTILNNPDPNIKNGKFKIDFKPDLINDYFRNVDVDYNYFIATFEEKNVIKNSYKSKWITGELFDFAYALTVHVSQGSEYNSCLYFEEFMRPNMMNQLNYTAITRAKYKLIYVKPDPAYFVNYDFNQSRT